MEARPDQLHGRSLRIHIPRLEIKNLRVENSMSPSCFSGIEPLTLSPPPESEETERGRDLIYALQTHPEFIVNVQANEVIILMINSFVDFFIQYYQYYHGHVYKVELNPLILKLKEIIFYLTNQSGLVSASDYNRLIESIMRELVTRELVTKDKLSLGENPKFYYFPKNVGRQFEYNADEIQASKMRLEGLTLELQAGPTFEWHRKNLQDEVDAINSYLDDKLFHIYTTSNFQKFEIFSLLFLSYHVLSTSGFFFTIEIQDLDEILLQEIKRTPSSSFILQFLPHDRTIINIIKTNLLEFFMRNSERYMPALRKLRDAPELQGLRPVDEGGSKRANNKSRKNKYKRKYNHKYKKSRKNKRHRRKRTQSTQNKMF
jgi:hypothetical protein